MLLQGEFSVICSFNRSHHSTSSLIAGLQVKAAVLRGESTSWVQRPCQLLPMGGGTQPLNVEEGRSSARHVTRSPTSQVLYPEGPSVNIRNSLIRMQ